MKSTATTTTDLPTCLLLALWLLADALRFLLVAAAALLLTLAGWRPSRSIPQAVEAPSLDRGITPPSLEGLPVRELRRLARAAGLPSSLSRSGRRSALLVALVAS